MKNREVGRRNLLIREESNLQNERFWRREDCNLRAEKEEHLQNEELRDGILQFTELDGGNIAK